MRQLAILILTSTIINLNCTGSRDNSKDIEINHKGIYEVDSVYRKLSVDEGILEKLVMNNRNFFETYTEHIYDEDQNPSNFAQRCNNICPTKYPIFFIEDITAVMHELFGGHQIVG